MKTANKTLAAVLTGLFASAALANQGEEFMQVKKSTFVNLVDLLVQRGVIDKKDGKDLVSAAEEESATAAAQAEGDKRQAAEPGKGKGGGKSLHVGYVPEFVKREIRDQLRAELKADVVKDVKAEAKAEHWGIPGALPEWVSGIKPYFDARIRLADEFYAPDNVAFTSDGTLNANAIDWLKVNENGGFTNALLKNELFLNNQKDRLRVRERFRLGFDAHVGDSITAGFRAATSNQFNPVSNDQSLGNTGQSWQFAIDRAFLQYDFVDSHKRDWFTLYGGRFANPFVSTDVVYDPDLSFEGVAGTFRLRFNQDDPTVAAYRAPNPTARFGINQGPQTPDTLFATFGAFPIQEVNFSTSDKWMFGGQGGLDWLVFGQSRLKLAASYYAYHNINARKNAAGSHEFDWTAPEFLQKGNTMVAITDFDPDPATSICNDPSGCLFGLASDFKIFNATAMFDYAGFGANHVLFTVDYAKNLGFDRNRILNDFPELGDVTPRTSAYQVRVDVGRPELQRFNDWNVTLAYRYLQSDSVLDAFTDSVFHQGGTNAKGWMLGANYGLARNTWLNLRWFSTDAIDGPQYAVDTVNLDLNARF